MLWRAAAAAGEREEGMTKLRQSEWQNLGHCRVRPSDRTSIRTAVDQGKTRRGDGRERAAEGRNLENWPFAREKEVGRSPTPCIASDNHCSSRLVGQSDGSGTDDFPNL